MSKKLSPNCVNCPSVNCRPPMGATDSPSMEKAPAFCPTKVMPQVMDEALAEYENPAVKEFARQASIQEFECYENTPEGRRTKNPRIVELVQFAHKMR